MRVLRLLITVLLAASMAFVATGHAQPLPAQPATAQPSSQETVTHLASPESSSSQTGTATKANGRILPGSFAGWTLAGTPQISTSPEVADPTDAAVMKEYGFTDFEGATYTRADGRKLTIKAARFEDASGAYGAFTFYKTPEMLNEEIGDQGYSLNRRILFYRGNVLVDAVFQQLSAMSAAELRELSGDLVVPRGNTGQLPGLPRYLPKVLYVKNTARYIMGPVALHKTGAPLTSQLVNFDKGAEVVLGDYNFSGTPATLMLIGYPTPQIAMAQTKEIESAEPTHQGGDTPISVRRTGPILAILSGPVSAGDAKAFLDQINYDADVTWNQNTYFTRRDNAANLIVGVIFLAAIICGLGVLAGVAFGGFRVLMKRLLPDRVFDRPEQMEIIALHLSDPVQKPRDSS